jgi:hypothetical protein
MILEGAEVASTERRIRIGRDEQIICLTDDAVERRGSRQPSGRHAQTHPWPGNVDHETLANCIAECFECAQTRTACADACLSEEDVAELRKCIRLNLDCADVCGTTGRVTTRQTEYDAPTSTAQVDSCREACATCAAECERHGHCRICGEACRRCEQGCTKLLRATN